MLHEERGIDEFDRFKTETCTSAELAERVTITQAEHPGKVDARLNMTARHTQ